MIFDDGEVIQDQIYDGAEVLPLPETEIVTVRSKNEK